MIWGDCSAERSDLVQYHIDRWKGTPYRADHQHPGVGADCRSFVLGVLDGLTGQVTDIGNLPPDTGLFSPEVARAFLHKVARSFNLSKVNDGIILPGDVIVTRLPHSGPTHGMIAGARPFIWHCVQGSGVTKTGLSSNEFPIEAVYRPPLS